MPNLPWLVYAMLLAPLGLILIATTVKTWQAREVRGWPQTSGKVVTSETEVREVKVSDDDREDGYRLEQRNFANVVYEYSVGGRKVRNNRISIGEDLGNFEVAEKLAKYPPWQRRGRLLQSQASGAGRARTRATEGHVGVSRHRHRDRARDRVRLGLRPQPELSLAFGPHRAA